VRLALSEISTLNATFAEDVTAYAAAGFDAIGLWEFKLPDDDKANRELLREHGLAVANCVPTVPSITPLAIPGMEGPSDVEERIEAICAAVRRFAAYEPECVLCLTGPLGGHSPDEARAIAISGLVRIAAAASEAGVRLGLEPIHPTERDTTSWINTVADAVDLLDDAGLDDVGIMVDTYNLWDDDGAADWLEQNPGRVSGVHVAGLPGDAEGRTLPGESGPRERELVEALRAGGWDGSLEVEIFATPRRLLGTARRGSRTPRLLCGARALVIWTTPAAVPKRRVSHVTVCYLASKPVDVAQVRMARQALARVPRARPRAAARRA
jgi:sugar phosphate isomerase/epimerase